MTYLLIPLWVTVLAVLIAVGMIGYIRYFFDKKCIQRLHTTIPNLQKFSFESKKNRFQKILHHTYATHIIRLCVVGGSFSSLPDIILIRLVRSKLSLFGRISAYTLGKLLLYIPIIYGTSIIGNILTQYK